MGSRQQPVIITCLGNYLQQSWIDQCQGLIKLMKNKGESKNGLVSTKKVKS